MVKKSNYSVLDTETSGLPNEPLAEVIEVAFQILSHKDLSVIAEFESLVKPKNINLNEPLPKWAQGAFRVNNISIEELKTAPSPEEVCEKIIGIFNAAKKPIVVAQNSAFDMEMMDRLFGGCGYDFTKYIYRPVIDLYVISHLLWVYDANMPNLKLQTVAEKMDVKILVDSETFFDSLKKDFRHARSNVYVQAMTFEGDKAGKELCAIMESSPAKDKRILIDSYIKAIINLQLNLILKYHLTSLLHSSTDNSPDEILSILFVVCSIFAKAFVILENCPVFSKKWLPFYLSYPV